MSGQGSFLALLLIAADWAIRLIMLVVVPMRRPPEAARSWLLLLLFLPVPGLILYHFIGRARFPRWRRARFAQTREASALAARSLPEGMADEARLAALACRLGGYPSCTGNAVRLLSDYDATIEAMIAEIDRAAHSIQLLTYIFADDRTGQSVAQALSRAHQRGVAVHVLIDALGSRAWAKRTLAMLHDMGLRAVLALPIRFGRFPRARADLRNHRKLCLIDGRIGFIGSQNIVDRDFKPGIVNEELVARVEGPVVAALASVFATDWYLETQEVLAPAPLPAPAGPVLLQAMPSGPDYGVPGYERLLIEMVHRAEREIVIVSPYLIPDEALLTGLKNAVLRGVNVHILVSRVVDQRIVSLAQHSYYEEFLSFGMQVHLYRDKLLHAKHVSMDGRFGIIGSSNTDVRSFMLNAETSLLIHDPAAAADLRGKQRHALAESDVLLLDVWRRRGLFTRMQENIARLVSPLL